MPTLLLLFLILTLLLIHVSPNPTPLPPPPSNPTPLSTSTSISPNTIPLDTLLKTALTHQINQDFPSALSQYQTILTLHPEHAEANHLLGLTLHSLGDCINAVDYIVKAFEHSKSDGSVSGLVLSSTIAANLGEIYRVLSDVSSSLHYLNLAIKYNPLNPLAYYNLAVILPRSSIEYRDALVKSVELDSTHVAAFVSLGQYWYGQNDHSTSLEYYMTAVDLGGGEDAVLGVAIAYTQLENLAGAEEFYVRAMNAFPESKGALLNYAVLLHTSGDEAGAILLYKRLLLLLDSQSLLASSVIDDNSSSIDRVEKDKDEDNKYMASIYNNIGEAYISSLKPTQNYEKGIEALEMALLLNPIHFHALINLARYFIDEGDVLRGGDLYDRAINVLALKLDQDGGGDMGLWLGSKIRKVTSLPPIPHSLQSSSESYDRMMQRMHDIGLHSLSLSLTNENAPLHYHYRMRNQMGDVHRIHFYVPYLGRSDDRLTQLLFAQVYVDCSTDELLSVNPNLVGYAYPHFVNPVTSFVVPNINIKTGKKEEEEKKKIRIGFISKFFGDFEPHGLLLEGIMRHLPRSLYTVILFHGGGGGGAAPYLTDAVEHVVTIAMSQGQSNARGVLNDANLDVLVFAEGLSEPMNYFLSYSRFAPVQMMFWGNPLTSGAPSIDYYVSSDRFEHPYRTSLSIRDDPYSEQVVLLSGLGLWYTKFSSLKSDYYNNGAGSDLFLLENPTISRTTDRMVGPRSSLSDFGLDHLGVNADTTIYLCAQNLFKLHPDFDYVIRDVLLQDVHGVVVFIRGARKTWTKLFTQRLQRVLPPSHFDSRVLLIDRMDSLSILNLIALSTVLLHPFPFDGSRTILDGLESESPLPKPVVTFPQTHLKGRMGLSYYSTMGVHLFGECCIASSRDDYVTKAVRLGADREYNREISKLIESRIGRIFGDRQVVWEWVDFLQRVSGVTPEHRVARGDVGFDIIEEWQSEEYLSEVMLTFQRDYDDSAHAHAHARQVDADYNYSRSSVPSSSSSHSHYESFLLTTANLYNSNGFLQKSLNQLRLLSYERPYDARVRNSLGAVLQQMQMLEEAEVELQLAIALDPLLSEAWGTTTTTSALSGRIESTLTTNGTQELP